MMLKNISIHPLTNDRWKDFETLFGAKGACGGCWCMHWRLKRSEFEKTKGAGNRKKMNQLVASGEVPGLLMFSDKKVAGWCSVGPRKNFPVLENSRILKPVDDQPVWSIVCFYIEKNYRRLGLSGRFLKFVIEYCKKHGAGIIEAYPLDVKAADYPSVFAYTGFYSAFIKAGFKEVARRSETRPIMRYTINQ